MNHRRFTFSLRLAFLISLSLLVFPGMLADMAAFSEAATYGKEFFVSPTGDDSNPGTKDLPFATLERARTAIRSLKQSPGLPVGGVVVWLRGGIYPRIATFALVTEDSGTAAKPVVYRGYPGEQARLVGGQLIDPRWFTTATNSSPAWPRMDPAARGRLLQVDLAARGITDYGRLTVRGFGASSTAAMELFFNQAPMTLARWPDPNENDKPASFTDDAITIYGTLVPDVTGSYVKSGSQDGVNAYVRQGLVGGKQYNLHRRTWVFEGI